MNESVNKIFRAWLPLVVTATLLFGFFYLAVQQNYRISANDPQIQIAEDITDQISNGQNPLSFVPSYKIELSKSLATYIMIFDQNGKLLGSSVDVNGKSPNLPNGVFENTKKSKNHETRFTWQPQQGIRSALVIDYYLTKQSGFVAVGRSLKEVEKRIDNLTEIVFIGWIVTLAASFISIYFLKKLR